MDTSQRKEELEGIVLVIPAFEPPETFPQFVSDLMGHGFSQAVVVNDGSDKRYVSLFEEVSAISNVAVLTHEANCGKGRSLKDAFAHCLESIEDFKGVVTADADGQHVLEDIVRVAQELEASDGQTLVMGARDLFNKEAPFGSRFGSRITQFGTRLANPASRSLTDGQSGLRGIPRGLLPGMLEMKGEEYEFESIMLMFLLKADTPVIEIPITTVYENGSTHYRPVRDTLRIMVLAARLLLAIAATSITSWLLDLVLFTVFVWLLNSGIMAGYEMDSSQAILVATLVARIISATVNFNLNKRKVFQSGGKTAPEAGKFVVVAAFILLCSASLVTSIQSWTGLPASMIKVVVDFLLYFLNFSLQKRFVFKKRSRS